MLVLAALVPDTALLVPGAAGRAVVLNTERAAAVAAARQVVAAEPDLVVVLAPGPSDRVLEAPAHPGLRAVGIGAGALGWTDAADVDIDVDVDDVAGTAGPKPETAPGPGPASAPRPESESESEPAVGASVALLLLAGAGWTGRTTVVELSAPIAAARASAGSAASRADGDHDAGGSDQPHAGDERAAALRALGAELAAGGRRVAFVLAGSLSGRNGPSAPLTHDDRAAPFDSAVLADLAAGDEPARARLAAIPAALAVELSVTAWPCVQALVGAAGAVPLEAAVRHTGAPFGVTYAVATWRPTGPS